MTHSACRIAVSARSKKLAVSGVSWAAGSYAVNPANRERIPIWVADYVLGSYGSGAIMAVPAHDARDHEFARVFDLPIRRVVSAGSSEEDQLPYASEPSFCRRRAQKRDWWPADILMVSHLAQAVM